MLIKLQHKEGPDWKLKSKLKGKLESKPRNKHNMQLNSLQIELKK
jgi:hypothetical protein